MVSEEPILAIALAVEAHWIVGLPHMLNVYAFGVLPGFVPLPPPPRVCVRRALAAPRAP